MTEFWKFTWISFALTLSRRSRSSRPVAFCKKGVIRNFAKFTGKYLCQSLRPATLLKKSLWHMCFPVNFPKSLRTPFFTEHLRWLLLYAFHRSLIVKEKRLLSLSYSLMRIRCRCYPFNLNYFSKSNKSKTTMKHN